MTSLLSIGTEFETLFLSPILVNDNSFTGIGKDFETLIKYQISKTPNHIFQVYGDNLGFKSDLYNDIRKYHSKDYPKTVSFRIPRQRQSVLSLTYEYFHTLFTDAEFINTFPENVSVDLTKEGLIHYILHHVKISASTIKQYLDSYSTMLQCRLGDFPYSYLMIDSSDTLVTRGHASQKQNKKTIVSKRLEVIKQRLTFITDQGQVQKLHNLKEKNQGYLRLLQQLDYRNTLHYRMGFLSLIPKTDINSQAQFVPQCTLGFPIINSITIARLLFEWTNQFFPDIPEVTQFEAIYTEFYEIYPKIIPLMSKNKIPMHRFELLSNYCFLFFYSITTLKKRKPGSLFILRNSFQDLAYVLTLREKRVLSEIVPERFLDIFDDIHFLHPYTFHPQKYERQELLDVSIITDPKIQEIKTKIFTQQEGDRIAQSLKPEEIKVFIEFRLLNDVLCRMAGIGNFTLTLDLMENI